MEKRDEPIEDTLAEFNRGTEYETEEDKIINHMHDLTNENNGEKRRSENLPIEKKENKLWKKVVAVAMAAVAFVGGIFTAHTVSEQKNTNDAKAYTDFMEEINDKTDTPEEQMEKAQFEREFDRAMKDYLAFRNTNPQAKENNATYRSALETLYGLVPEAVNYSREELKEAIAQEAGVDKSKVVLKYKESSDGSTEHTKTPEIIIDGKTVEEKNMDSQTKNIIFSGNTIGEIQDVYGNKVSAQKRTLKELEDTAESLIKLSQNRVKDGIASNDRHVEVVTSQKGAIKVSIKDNLDKTEEQTTQNEGYSSEIDEEERG